MAKVDFEITVPDRLLQSFLQHLRDFDAQHMNEVQMKMWVTETDLTPKEMEEIFCSLRPPFTFFTNLKTKPS